MGNTMIAKSEVTFDQVLTLAQKLPPVDQIRLLAKLAPNVEWALDQVESSTAEQQRKPLRGLVADLGPAPSAEEIDEVQHEMWASFGQNS